MLDSLKYQKDYRRKYPERELLYKSRKRAKALNIENDLSIEDINIPKLCPVLGLELEIADGHCSDCSPTIDRINNSKGYISDNISVISWKANKMKSDATIEELEKVLEYMKSNRCQNE